MLLHSKIV